MSHPVNSQIAENLRERLVDIMEHLTPEHIEEVASLLDTDLEEAEQQITRLEHEISFALSGRDL